MKDFREHSEPELTRCIVTYNNAEVNPDAAISFLQSMQIPMERFNEGTFKHLEGIGSSVIDLTRHELDNLRKMIGTVGGTRVSHDIAITEIIGDMKIFSSAPWSLASISEYILHAVRNNVHQAIRVISHDGNYGIGRTVTTTLASAVPTILLVAMKLSADDLLRGIESDSDHAKTFKVMTAAGGMVLVAMKNRHQNDLRAQSISTANAGTTELRRKRTKIGANLQSINAPKAWKRGITGKGVKIAVLDTGIDRSHPDLAGTVHRGISIVGEDSCTDNHGHGTNCAGIIAAANGIGVAPDAEVYSVKVLADNGEGFLSDILAGIEWVVQRNKQLIDKFDVVSTSIAVQQDTRPIASITQAVKSLKRSGCVMVAGTGNDGDEINAPANSPGVIAVGAVDDENRLWYQSAFGGEYNQVTIVAPGVDVRTTGISDDGYATIDGTSAACAHVSGMIALVKQALPWLTADEIIQHLKSTANSFGLLHDRTKYGAGLIDCDKAIMYS